MSSKPFVNICTALSAIPALRFGAASIVARLSSISFIVAEMEADDWCVKIEMMYCYNENWILIMLKV
jgi:hypothetical protein